MFNSDKRKQKLIQNYKNGEIKIKYLFVFIFGLT